MKCLIVSGGVFSKVRLPRYDLTIACDKGYLNAKKLKIKPDIIVGDFDSSKEPTSHTDGKRRDELHEPAIIKFDAVKDDTDTGLAIKYALRNNYKDIDIICALGNRLDHTIANISMLKYIYENGGHGRILSNGIEIRVVGEGVHKIEKRKKSYLSLFSFDKRAKINYIKGTKYDRQNVVLKNSFPLGVSNEFKNKVAEINVGKGIVIVMVVEGLA